MTPDIQTQKEIQDYLETFGQDQLDESALGAVSEDHLRLPLALSRDSRPKDGVVRS